MAKERRSRKPAVTQNAVLARTLAGQSNSQIASEMGIDRETVTRIQECHNLPQLLADSRQYIVQHVVPDALESVHAQIKDRGAPGDGNLAIRTLEGIGVLGDNAPKATFNFHDDAMLQMGVALLPPLPQHDAPSQPSNGAWPQPAQPGEGQALVAAAGDGVGGGDGNAAAPAQVIARPAPKPSEPINIVTGKHDRFCRCCGCRPDLPQPG